jgi:hypothetical protein
MQYDNGKDNSARLASLVVAFRKAIYDQLKEMAGANAYIPSTASLRAAAFKAIEEIVESEQEDLPPRLLLNVWNAVMLTNESAFHQTMEREIKAGTLSGITMAKGAKAVSGQYY